MLLLSRLVHSWGNLCGVKMLLDVVSLLCDYYWVVLRSLVSNLLGSNALSGLMRGTWMRRMRLIRLLYGFTAKRVAPAYILGLRVLMMMLILLCNLCVRVASWLLLGLTLLLGPS